MHLWHSSFACATEAQAQYCKSMKQLLVRERFSRLCCRTPQFGIVRCQSKVVGVKNFHAKNFHAI